MRISNSLKPLKFTYDSLFQVGYFLMIMNQLLSQSQFNTMTYPSLVLKITRWLLVGYFGIIIYGKKNYPLNRRGLFWICFASISIIEMFFFNGKLLLVILFFLVTASYKTDIEAMINTHIKALSLGLLLVIFCSLVGILDTLGVYKQFDNISGFLFKQNNMRYAFGFVNSNIIPITFLYLYLYYVIKYKDRYKWYFDFFVAILNFAIYQFCGSRVCIVLLFFSIILRILIKANKQIFLSFAVPTSVILLIGSLIISLIIPKSSLYSTPIVKVLDDVLTARISIIRLVLSRFPISVFGHGEIAIESSTDYLIMDNGYVALFVMRGLIIGLIFTFIILNMINFSRTNKDPYLLMLVIIMILANLVDNSILHYITFPIYILFFNATNTSKIKEKLKYDR